jgi:pimeloyl-ACP methyl ester carboxylesterase
MLRPEGALLGALSRCLWVCLFGLTGCLRLVTAPSPMKSLADPAATEPARCLVVFLPGVADRAGTFRAEGFVDELRARRMSVDAIAADATVGYYLRGVEAPAIERDVVRPAARGYEQVWMVGVSMGGFGALHYAASFPSRLDGVLVLAPHLGEQSALQPIRDAGGLAAWQPPPPERFHGRNYTEDTWRWVREVAVEGRRGPQLYLGYGTADFVTGQPAILAAVLPRSHVLRDAGGHSWSTWRRLWARFLDASVFRERCGAQPGDNPARSG